MTDQERIDISEDLFYEITQLLGMASMRLTERHQVVDHNAYLESFLIHARALRDFFYGRRSRPDDVIAADYVDDNTAWAAELPGESASIEELRERVGKEVAHLTLTRLQWRLNKEWDYVELAMEFDRIFQRFLDHVPCERLHEDSYTRYQTMSAYAAQRLAAMDEELRTGCSSSFIQVAEPPRQPERPDE